MPLALKPLFADRADAGRQLADALALRPLTEPVVVGLARGGVEVAVEVARALGAPLDAIAVRKIGHPRQPEYAIGAVTPGGGVYLRPHDDVSSTELAAAIDDATTNAAALDRRLHAAHAALAVRGRAVVVVDDGLATGATMIAALRWARSSGAAAVVAAVPVGAPASVDALRGEADLVVCLHVPSAFYSVGTWYGSFAQIDDDRVKQLIDESRARLT